MSAIGIFLIISILSYSIKGPGVPALTGAFDEVSVTSITDKPNDAGILVVFHVRNVGTPSIVSNYSLTVTPAGWQSEIPGTIMFIPKVLQIPPTPNTPQVFVVPFVCGKDALYRKTTEQPLVYGAQETGVLLFDVPGVAAQSLANPTGTKFHMAFSDVLGKTYGADFTWPAVPLPTGYVPGTGVPNTANPDEACND
jgi:hypothetical protein